MEESKVQAEESKLQERSSLIDEEPRYIAPRAALEETKTEEEPFHIAPRPQVFDQMLGDEESVPEQIVEQPSETVATNEPYKGNLEGLSYIPQPYVKPQLLSKKLDIANLVEEDKKRRERADFFTCPICAMVVLDPQECSSCQSMFCADCIAPWRERN